jgi:RNA polymerase sigma factor (sigma-70 family)
MTLSSSSDLVLRRSGLEPVKPLPSQSHASLLIGHSQQRPVECALLAALRRARSWPVPLNWSASDWKQEIESIGMGAQFEALSVFDPDRQIPIEKFIYQRVTARLLSSYRREWAYGTRFLPLTATAEGSSADGCFEEEEDKHKAREPQSKGNGLQQDLNEAVSALSEAQQWLVIGIFWRGNTERELAELSGISQRGVSKRKQEALRRLREWFGLEAQRTLPAPCQRGWTPWRRVRKAHGSVLKNPSPCLM